MYFNAQDFISLIILINSIPEFVNKYSVFIGLDSTKFDECLDSGEMASEVKADFEDGQRAGVRGTPSFIINDKVLSGAQPFENFKAVIDAELA